MYRPSLRTQQVKHFLLKWYKLDSNINDLSDIETVQAKILYTALKKMDPEEVRFLASKYRYPKPITDAVLTKEYGLSQEKYRKKRFDIEVKMLPFINDAVEHYQEELSKAVLIEAKYKRLMRIQNRKDSQVRNKK